MRILYKAALPLALLSAVPANAAVDDLGANWSDANNPNGAWSYGPGLTHFAQPVTPNALNPAAGNGYWGSGPDFTSAPFILKSTANGSTLSGGYSNNDFLMGDVLVHGPNDGTGVAINWTAQGVGSISFTSSIWYAHSPVQRSQDVSVFLNNTALGTVTVTNGITRPNALTALAGSNLAVATGDVLSFRFTKTSGQSFGSISGIGARVDFTPQVAGAVPEPATWAMLIVGFGAIGGAMRRRPRVAMAI